MGHHAFSHYEDLCRKVDAFTARVVQTYERHIRCRYGCTRCCQQDLTLVPVEFFYLHEGLGCLEEEILLLNQGVLQPGAGPAPCLLLHGGGCLLYPRRPMICRTHGLPLLIGSSEGDRRDCCPENFSSHSMDRLPEADLLHLETLNTILITLNKAFCAQVEIDSGQRIPITELLNENVNRKT